MVSLPNTPNITGEAIQRENLAQQSLWLRLGLVFLFTVVGLWVSPGYNAVLLIVSLFVVSSALLAVGYWTKLLCPADVHFAGMLDTSLFLGAGVIVTGGPQSPVLFLFIGTQAAFFILTQSKLSIIVSSFSILVLTAAVLLSGSNIIPDFAEPQQHPMAYLLAASGMLAILAAVGSAHGVEYTVRTLERKSRQLTLLSDLMSWSYSGADEEQSVNKILEGLSGQLIGSGPASILAVLFDGETGSITATVWSPASPRDFQHPTPGEHTGDLKDLFRQWRNPLPRTYHSGEPINRWVRELLAGPEDAGVLCFPVHAAGSTFGMIAVVTTERAELDLDGNQRLVDAASSCLLNTRRQEAQARQNRELQQQDLLRRSFLSYVTHEFRTPLASLQTSFELIQEAEVMRGLDDPYQRLLVNVNRSIATLGQLTNDMAEAANLSAGGVVLDRMETAPADIVYPVIETTSPLSRLKNQSLEVDIRPGLPNLMADGHRLEQVLTNMISNAIKYTPPGGTIKTVVSQEENSIRFAVSDSGRGIPKEDLGKVFDPFFRVPQQSNDRTPGTGLGLALAKSLVELHGGDIWAESEPKKGSTFVFTIPLE